MGTQTITDTHSATTFTNWGRQETSGATSVTVKQQFGSVIVAVGNETGIHMNMTQENAIIFAQAIIEAATGKATQEDAFRFVKE